MSKINVNTWEPEGSSTDAVMMASGDTVTVPSGATLAIASGATVTNSGTSTGFGATNNIQRATGDVTIATTTNRCQLVITNGFFSLIIYPSLFVPL